MASLYRPNLVNVSLAVENFCTAIESIQTHSVSVLVAHMGFFVHHLYVAGWLEAVPLSHPISIPATYGADEQPLFVSREARGRRPHMAKW